MSEISDALGHLDSYFPQPEFRPGQPLYFIHVRKCAGTSVRLMVENPFPGGDVFPSGNELLQPGYLRYRQVLDSNMHLGKFQVITGHFGVLAFPLLTAQTNCFIWLRSPRQRAISDFFFSVAQEQEVDSRDRIFRVRLRQGERPETVFMDWLRQTPGHCTRYQAEILGLIEDPDDLAWPEIAAGRTLVQVIGDVLRRCFFIGLADDHQSSLDAFCALTGILPPKQDIRYNPGRVRKERLALTEQEEAELSQILAPDLELFAIVEQIYRRQMERLAPPRRREDLRAAILKAACAEGKLTLQDWDAWDPVYGENLESREIVQLADGSRRRWRWTCPEPDTLLYFTLPRNQPLFLRMKFYQATPAENVARCSLRIGGHRVPLTVTNLPEEGWLLEGVIGKPILAALPDVVEFHLHTPVMLDESTLGPGAGVRQLGVALERISVQPLVF